MTDNVITFASILVLVWCACWWATVTVLIWREDRRWRKWWTTGEHK